MFNQCISLLVIQGEIIKALETENRSLEKEVDDLRSDVDDLNDEITELENKFDEADCDKADAISALREVLLILKEVREPGEYGSLKQRAWDAYHKYNGGRFGNA